MSSALQRKKNNQKIRKKQQKQHLFETCVLFPNGENVRNEMNTVNN